MRKIVYLLFLPLLFAANTGKAQNFSMQHDTVKSTVPVYTDIYNYVNNTSGSTISVNWRIISETLPQSWEDHGSFGLCDNVTCYTTSILAGTAQTSDTFSGSKMLFKMQFDGSPASVTPGGPYYVTAEISDMSFTDTVTFELYKWPASVPKVTNSIAKEEVTLYPNPAYNEVNVTFSKEAGIKTIAIYNLVGKQVAAYRNTNNSSAKLDIDKIPSGIYFVRLMDGAGRTVATRRFTHQ
jgi:hypothetical protein